MSDANEKRTDEPFGKKLREAWLRTVGAWATDESGTATLLSRLQAMGTVSAEEARRVGVEDAAEIIPGAKQGDEQHNGQRQPGQQEDEAAQRDSLRT